MADALKYHEEKVSAGSTEEQRLIVNLTAQGWKLLVRVGETDKHDYAWCLASWTRSNGGGELVIGRMRIRPVLNLGSSRAALLIRVIGDLRASVELSSAAGAVGICFLEAAFPFSQTL